MQQEPALLEDNGKTQKLHEYVLSEAITAIVLCHLGENAVKYERINFIVTRFM